jgi:2'-5' RNA ligase
MRPAIAAAPAGPLPAGETHYGVGVLPPPDIGAAVDRYRARYDGDFYARTVPHITVKQTFRLLCTEAELVSRLRAVCRETSPFPVGLVGVRVFGHGGRHVVYLHVPHTDELMAFQRRLVRALADVAGHSPHYTLDYELTSYLPHMTIGQNLSEERLAEIRAELTAESYYPAFCFPVTHVSVARRDPESVWRRPYRVALGTGELVPEPYPEPPPWRRSAGAPRTDRQ